MIFAVPAVAAWNVACSVPPESYVALVSASTVPSEVVGAGYLTVEGPLYPLGTAGVTGASVRLIWSPTVSCTGVVGKFCVSCTVVAADTGTATSATHPAAATIATATRVSLRGLPHLTTGTP